MKLAFQGFRHGHIYTIWKDALANSAVEIVATCEPDDQARAKAEADLNIKIEYTNFDQMLKEADFDVLAIGDYFGIRGEIAIKALKAGKHVIADKPLCTSLEELSEIKKLSSEKGLLVGLMLDMRYYLAPIKARELVRSGEIGEIMQVQFGGQHPLNYGSRPMWYFEKGKHGGTINDIAIHGIDIIDYIAGIKPAQVLAARCWNGFADKEPDFKDSAQFMLKMDNGAGVLADVSYASPNTAGFSLPQYWRFTFWGSKGVIEFSCNDKEVKMAKLGDTNLVSIPVDPDQGHNTITDFLNEMAGKPTILNTETVLTSSENTLKIQAFADKE